MEEAATSCLQGGAASRIEAARRHGRRLGLGRGIWEDKSGRHRRQGNARGNIPTAGWRVALEHQGGEDAEQGARRPPAARRVTQAPSSQAQGRAGRWWPLACRWCLVSIGGAGLQVEQLVGLGLQGIEIFFLAGPKI